MSLAVEKVQTHTHTHTLAAKPNIC